MANYCNKCGRDLYPSEGVTCTYCKAGYSPEESNKAEQRGSTKPEVDSPIQTGKCNFPGETKGERWQRL